MKGAKIRRKEWLPLVHIVYKDNLVQTYQGQKTHFYDKAEIILSDGWQVIGEEERGEFNFIDIIEELKNKKQVRQKNWPDNKYLYIDTNQFVACEPIPYDFMPTFACLCANDWEIIS